MRIRHRGAVDAKGHLHIAGYAVYMLVFVLISVGSITLARQSEDLGAKDGATIWVVSAGDTLWGIAKSMSEPGDDIRQIVYSIRSANGLDDLSLTPGQSLVIPGRSR